MLFPLMFSVLFVNLVAWIAALILGRIPRGFRDLLANVLRYNAQISAFTSYYLTGRYPCSSPYVGMSLGAPVVEAVEAPAKKAPAKK
jgi:hypothetical protein